MGLIDGMMSSLMSEIVFHRSVRGENADIVILAVAYGIQGYSGACKVCM